MPLDGPEIWTPKQPVLFRQLSSKGRYRFIERVFDPDANGGIGGFVEQEPEVALIGDGDSHELVYVHAPDVPSDGDLAFTFGMLASAADAPKE